MSRSLAVFVTLLCLVLFSSSAHGWWCEGHMLVAEIARRHLKPGVAEKVDAIIAEMSGRGPYPKSSTMVSSACWSDDLKSFGLTAMSGWHFINTPYNPSRIAIKGSPVQKMNVATVITSLEETLKSNRGAPVSVIGFALLNLIHFYGDIHQPLHATTMFSPAHPKGDYGGNLVNVFLKNRKMTLHAVWDSMCQGPKRSLRRPFFKKDYATIVEFADYLERTYSFTDAQKKNTQSAAFAKESYQMAVDTVYNGITNGMTLSDDYTQKCKRSAESRVTIAGYRLATQLNKLFSTDSGDVHPLNTDGAKRSGSLLGIFSYAQHAKKKLIRAYG